MPNKSRRGKVFQPQFNANETLALYVLSVDSDFASLKIRFYRYIKGILSGVIYNNLFLKIAPDSSRANAGEKHDRKGQIVE